MKGFSLIELLIVLAIVLIVFAMVLPQLVRTKGQYKITTPQGVFYDRGCFSMSGGVQCKDRAYYGNVVLEQVK